MLFFNGLREDLLSYLPKGIVCTEVGVAWGAFSKQIMEIVRPRKLHLIDPWVRQERDDYKNDPNNAAPDEQEKRYRDLVEAYRGIEAVEIHRAYSTEQAARFAPGYFDFIYIDAMHTHDAVIADLKAFAPALKEDGLMFGHDFASHASGRNMNFGVVGGVTEFLKQSEFELLVVTSEQYSTYVLGRRNKGGTRNLFLSNLLTAQRFAVELPNELAGSYQQKRVTAVGGKLVRNLPSFRIG